MALKTLDKARSNHLAAAESRPRVLIVDDDQESADLLRYALSRAGMDVSAACDSGTAHRRFDVWRPDLVLLDIMPDRTARLHVLARLRRRSQVPIIIVSALRSEDDKVRAFALGADDYVIKPFSHRELIVRMRTQLRLAGHDWSIPVSQPDHLTAGPLTLDMTEHRIITGKRHVALTPMEFRLLACLMTHANDVVPVAAIQHSVWPAGAARDKATLQVLVHRLRRKIEHDPAQPRLLHTVPGVGLRLACTGAEDAL